MGMKTTEHPTLNIQHSTSNEGRGKAELLNSSSPGRSRTLRVPP
jgi:hypothetical protein